MEMKEKMNEGEALYIKMLPNNEVGCKFFNGKNWDPGRIFPYPWYKLMNFFTDIDDLKESCLYEKSTLKEFNEEISNSTINEIYNEVAEMMYRQFHMNSSVEHCKGYILEDVLNLFEEKFPNLKRMTIQEYKEKHPFYIEVKEK